MTFNAKNNGQEPDTRVILSLTLLNAIRQLNTLHQEIIRDEGQVVARLDETEQFLQERLGRIRSMRLSIRERTKQMRQVEAEIVEMLGS